jgi:OH-DDVA oxygenase/3-O-methylgallate 3,4-dioxygenase
MANIIFGAATSHSPQLHTPPEQWDVRVGADMRNPAHLFRGRTYDWQELVSLRASECLADQITLEERKKRFEAGTRAIEELASAYRGARPDVAVVIGNDQHELFTDHLMPAFTVYCGAEIENVPRTEEQVKRLPEGIHVADRGHVPPKREVYPGLPELGLHIIDCSMREGFDVAYSRQLPKVPREVSVIDGIPHAYGFVYRQIMQDRVIPNVPVILNTWYPPNCPTVKRCFQFGRLIGQAIASWPADRRVAVFASGGLSHFVVDEDFDRRFLAALASKDPALLLAFEESCFRSGTSEAKSWITLAGIFSESPLRMRLVDYQPFYRSLAGNGTGTAYACWS